MTPPNRGIVVLLLVLSAIVEVNAQSRLLPPPKNHVLIPQGVDSAAIVQLAASVHPSRNQLAWQRREFAAFLHFGMNTFTDREWGNGQEDPALFSPTHLDARQWARVCKQAGVRLIILTAKHHDGFCLWPSALTNHTVASSPWRGGKGDVVRELAEACRASGLALGLYLSPWDRHERSYGDSPAYNAFFRGQLTELLSHYGPIAEVWFDGACGEGPNGKRQVYDWTSYYRVVRQLQPNAVIAIMGPDVRWVGTESGFARTTEWSVIPLELPASQKLQGALTEGLWDRLFYPRDMMGEALGSVDQLRRAHALIWYPAEADVSIRPGWFYHATDDTLVKTPTQLVEIYYGSVGRNSTLVLNIPPDKRGLIHDRDIAALRGMRKILDGTFGANRLKGARARASAQRGWHGPALLLDDNPATSWKLPPDSTTGWVQCDLPAAAECDCVELQEEIASGQRVEEFRLEGWVGNRWVTCASGTTIGWKRLVRFPPMVLGKIRLTILRSRAAPSLSGFRLFKQPPESSS
jgi:alpha-L-fucosidase